MKFSSLSCNIEDLSYDEIKRIPISKIISTIHRTHLVYINHHLKEFDISYGQFHYLMILFQQGSQTQEQLVKFFNVTDGVVTRALDKLEDSDLILRKQDSNNKRRNIISLTSKGKKLAKDLEYLEDFWEEKVYASLNKDDFDKMKYDLHIASINALNIL